MECPFVERSSAKFNYFSCSNLSLPLVLNDINQTSLIVPFLKEISIPLGLGFIILSYFVVVGTSNAVNLTDGLDGLAILPL